MSLRVVVIGNPMTEKWECQCSVNFMNGTRIYSVINTEPEAKRETRWGPFYSEEEAYRVSGMPRPKTELEDLWGFVDELNKTLDGFCTVNQFEAGLSRKIAELKAKWKK